MKDTDEYNSYNYTESLYERGGWIIGGLESYQAESSLIYDDQKKELSNEVQHSMVDCYVCKS